ncbi:hypothetical protein TSAR_002742 [Trichomalopsis sarcophagae]|uniref:Uncharacterized protein n=1 Tax=Trichomalopsis sarcophagae TaxID=543379 RepID=A0A232EFV7_9HYME|nr:hypothetical protein TSAR_002742 [Trichomalopsis sarcophagae]
MDKSIPHLIVHWGGKLIPDTITCKQIDSSPILMCNGNVKKIINTKKGSTIGNAVYQALDDWGLTYLTQRVCCNTILANFGHRSGFEVKVPGKNRSNVPIFTKISKGTVYY